MFARVPSKHFRENRNRANVTGPPPSIFLLSLEQWLSNGLDLPLREHLAKSEDNFDCHDWEDTAGI